MLMHPQILGLGTIATAVLNGKRQFLLPAVSIAIYDFGLIGGLLFSLAIPAIGIYGPTFGLLASAVRLLPKVKTDKGMQRLHQRRLHAKQQKRQTKPLVSLLSTEEPREEESEGVAT